MVLSCGLVGCPDPDDYAPNIGVDPARLEADTRAARGTRPFVMASLRDGAGVAEIVAFIEDAGGLG